MRTLSTRPMLSTFNARGLIAEPLHDTRNSPRVFWSSIGNSYVLVALPDESSAYERYHALQTSDGTRVLLYSVNGCGEVRWLVPGTRNSTPTDAEARDYFRLSPLA